MISRRCCECAHSPSDHFSQVKHRTSFVCLFVCMRMWMWMCDHYNIRVLSIHFVSFHLTWSKWVGDFSCNEAMNERTTPSTVCVRSVGRCLSFARFFECVHIISPHAVVCAPDDDPIPLPCISDEWVNVKFWDEKVLRRILMNIFLNLRIVNFLPTNGYGVYGAHLQNAL